MFIYTMHYLKFSDKLSIFYDVISLSLPDVVFFIITMVIYLLGYSLMGHMLFGISDGDFESFWDSTLTLFLITIGTKSTLDIKTFDLVMRSVFGVSYMVISLLLLNMLVAIYISHYFQYKGEMGNTKMKFINLICKII